MVEQINETGETVPESDSLEKKRQSILDLQPKMKLSGTVQRLELYGAFIDIGYGVSAILHISKLDRKVNRISDALAVGDEIAVWVDSIDPQRDQVTVSMIEPLAVEWRDLKKDQVYTGTVTRLEKFGAFVDIGAEKEGLVHISELSHDYIKHPSEAVKNGETIQVVVLGFNKRKRRIDLSRKAMLGIQEAEEEVEETESDEVEEAPTSMQIAMRRAMHDSPDEQSDSEADTKAGAGEATKRGEQEDILSRTLKLSQESNS
jgi:ribosomal protein S1